MATPRSWLLVLLLGVVASACGGKEPPPPVPPSLSVALAGPATEHCSTNAFVLSATFSGDTPYSVEVLEDGKTAAWLSPPYQHTIDCASRAERPYTLAVRAYIAGHSFTSPSKELVVDRTPPTVVSGPFLPNQPEIAKDAPIRVTFSEPIQVSQVPANSISLVTATTSMSWSLDRKVLTLTPREPIAPPQSFTLILYPEGFRDLAGNPLAPSFPPTMQWSWHVPAFLHTWSLPKYGNGLSAQEPPAFARDRSGRLVVAWFEFTSASGATNVYVHRSDASGGTLLEGPLSAMPGNDTWVEEVQVAVDASDRPVVAWAERVSGEARIFVRRWNGASWEVMGSVPNPIVGVDAKDLTLATGGSDLPVVAWTEVDAAQKSVVFVYRWDGTRWDPVASPIVARTPGASVLFPSLAIDVENRPVLSVTEHSAEQDFQEEVVVWRLTGATWEQMGPALRPDSANVMATVHRSSLALDPQGRPGVAFELSTPGTVSSAEVYFARYEELGWTMPQGVDGPSARWPSLSFDAEGSPWVAWENGDSAANLAIRVRKMVGEAPYAALDTLYRPRFANGGVGPPVLVTVDSQRKAAQVVTRQ